MIALGREVGTQHLILCSLESHLLLHAFIGLLLPSGGTLRKGIKCILDFTCAYVEVADSQGQICDLPRSSRRTRAS